MTKYKRSWFHIHLSTCVVVMLLAGVLVGANIVGTKRSNLISYDDLDKQGWHFDFFEFPMDFPEWAEFSFGWPLTAFEAQELESGLINFKDVKPSYSSSSWASPVDLPEEDKAVFQWHFWAILADGAVALGLLAAATLTCEWVFRRRQSQRAGG